MYGRWYGIVCTSRAIPFPTYNIFLAIGTLARPLPTTNLKFFSLPAMGNGHLNGSQFQTRIHTPAPDSSYIIALNRGAIHKTATLAILTEENSFEFRFVIEFVIEQNGIRRLRGDC